jgi:DNA mismatch repair protein MutS2
MAALIERLERKEKELEEREREAKAMQDDARDRIANVARREQNVRERERTVEKESRKEARKYVLEARSEIERTIKELKRRGEAAADEAIDELGRDARRRAEEMAAKQADVLDRLENEERAVARKRGSVPLSERGPVAVNDAVEVGTLGGKVGRVLDVRGKEAVVVVGSLKLTVPARDASEDRGAAGGRRSATSETRRGARQHRDQPPGPARRRGRERRAPGARQRRRADLKSLRIIHGKGTGALREVVNEMLRKDTRVREFRMGAWNEGGAGVTIAVFA